MVIILITTLTIRVIRRTTMMEIIMTIINLTYKVNIICNNEREKQTKYSYSIFLSIL